MTEEKKWYHVHVYQVSVLGEVNIEADNPIEAREIAMEMSRKGEVSLRFPDCGTLAIAFENDDRHSVLKENFGEE